MRSERPHSVRPATEMSFRRGKPFRKATASTSFETPDEGFSRGRRSAPLLHGAARFLNAWFIMIATAEGAKIRLLRAETFHGMSIACAAVTQPDVPAVVAPAMLNPAAWQKQQLAG
jgi:hypothetical protein